MFLIIKQKDNISPFTPVVNSTFTKTVKRFKEIFNQNGIQNVNNLTIEKTAPQGKKQFWEKVSKIENIDLIT